MKTAIVTGAAQGMGLEWCRQLSLRGYQVVLTARSAEKAERAAGLLAQENIKVMPMVLDVEQEEDIEHFVKEFSQHHQHLDVLINNAALNPKDYPDKQRFAKTFYLDQLDMDEVLRVIRVNALAPAIMVKHLRSILKASARPVVLNISSWLGSITVKNNPGHYGYATGKSALNMVNKAMALELHEEGIICVVVNPGWVKTRMGGDSADLTTEQAIHGMIEKVLNQVDLGDSGKFFNQDGSEHPW
ncbi:SDR family oxidoreductase [Thiolapillus sp.]